ncbi:hypothetical protein GCM10027569_39470 [Flindersiella endophytica]
MVLAQLTVSFAGAVVPSQAGFQLVMAMGAAAAKKILEPQSQKVNYSETRSQRTWSGRPAQGAPTATIKSR